MDAIYFQMWKRWVIIYLESRPKLCWLIVPSNKSPLIMDDANKETLGMLLFSNHQKRQ
jgi:hypothetical protein